MKKRKRTGAGLFIFDNNKNILLLKRAKDSSYPLSWSLPGGSLEESDLVTSVMNPPDESYTLEEYFNCAKRETLEETNIDLDKHQYDSGFYNYNQSGEYQYITFYIKVSDLKELEKDLVLDKAENIEFKLFSKQDIYSLARHMEDDKKEVAKKDSMHPGLSDIIEEVFLVIEEVYF